MDDTKFSQIASRLLHNIADTIEEIDSQGLIDIDFNSDIINLITEQGTFVINKHSAAKEIWLASPVSGPYHFSYKLNRWRSRDNIDLFDILEKELKIDFSKTSQHDS